MPGFINGKLGLDSQLVATSSGENNNVAVNSSLMYISVTNEMDTITGLDPEDFADGYLIFIVNISLTKNLLLKNNSGSSLSTNVILTADGQDLVVPPLNTAILGYDTTNLMWHILRIPNGTHTTYQATPSDPTGTTNTTGLMMGLGGSFTPSSSGKVMIVVSGNIAATGVGGGSGAKTQIRYGTGTAPTNGAALTGTAVGNMAQIVNAALALLTPGNGNFTCNAVVSGLTLGTTYWIDQSLARITSGTASISGISISIIEI